MTINSKLRGTGVALVTPFFKDGSIDYKSFEKIIEFNINGGVDYLVALGTTGETPTIFNKERKEIITFVKETVNNRIPLVIGIGGNSTQEVLEFMREISFEGIDAILSVCPYYNKPSQDGILLHYKTIGEFCPVPLIIYNVPGRTGVAIKSETVLKIAKEVDTVIAVKEAAGDLIQCMEIIKNKPDGFIVLSGDDALVLPQISIGIDGVISVVANAFPNDFSKMVKLALKGDFEEAKNIHYKLIDIIHMLFVEGNPVGIKAALEIKNLCDNNLRSPLIAMSENNYNQLKKLIEEF